MASTQEIPVNVVGSSSFGIYPKISVEKTYNMFISDGWLVNYSGFKKIDDLLSSGEGRGAFRSERGNFVLAAVSGGIYRINSNLSISFIGPINTQTGNVVMDENLSSQIAIADGQDLWIYSYVSGNLTQQTLTFSGSPIIPNYVTYHNSYFLIASNPVSDYSQNWYAYDYSNDDAIKFVNQFSIQSKPDSAIAVTRLPGKGNNIIVFGHTVAEVWTQVPTVQVYQKIQSFNIDSGCVSVSTIASSKDLVCWIAQNENSAPSIMITDGGSTKKISTDGISYLLQTIVRPDRSTAFLFEQDGHLFYQFTFYDPRDNLSMVYDFNSDKFYHISDEDLNYHPARKVISFNNKIYFLSLNDAAFYEMGTEFISYKYTTDIDDPGEIIPRIRICKTCRRENSMPFRANKFTFWIEQGVNEYYLSSNPMTCDGYVISESGGDYIITEDGAFIITEDAVCASQINVPRVDMSISTNGNQSFSNVVSRDLNPQGKYRNIINWYRLGRSNELTIQLRFWGLQRFVANNGTVSMDS